MSVKHELQRAVPTISIIVATHKQYWMPSDPIYLPIHVGKVGKVDLGYTGDDTGDNISIKNPNYCELTGLYWAWKNRDADYIGLVHYRRHFGSGKLWGDKKKRVIGRQNLARALEKTDVLLPKPRHYWIETNYSQYAHAHHAIDLDTTRQILAEKSPECLPAFDASMKRTSGHRFNMFVMKREILDRYCTWLFDILFELEKRLDISMYTANDQRVFGFVSERLLDVWIETNRISYTEIPVICMENQHWLRKGSKFIMRKFAGKKHDQHYQFRL